MARVFVVLAAVAFAGFSQAANSPLLDINAVVGANVFPENLSLVGSAQNILSTLNDDNAMSTIFQNFLNKVGSAKGQVTNDLAERKQNLKDNILAILQSNFNVLNTFTMGLNKFSDMSAAEFKATHRNAIGETSQNGTSSNDADAPVGSSLRRKRQAPACGLSKDWTAEGMVTPVRDQAQCGSCFAFGSTAILESMYLIKCGVSVDLSEQNLMDCSKPQGNLGCDGGNAINSLTYFQNEGGLAMESDYPYKAETGTSCQAAKTKTGKVNAFNRLSPLNDEVALAKAVCQGPVVVRVNADGWSQYTGGVFGAPPVGITATTTTTTTTTTPKPTTKKPSGIIGSFFSAGASVANAMVSVPVKAAQNVAQVFAGAFNSVAGAATSGASVCSGTPDHLVLITGFGTDEQTGLDYWKIKNSWGANWGEQGYIRIKRGSNTCGVSENPFQLTDVQC